ncbi:MAG: hypothetical protein GXP14_10400 [Gammaproteobacteria bacterium]|nr:hypothetical protein [Gammaproteobacteria bacterium]
MFSFGTKHNKHSTSALVANQQGLSIVTLSTKGSHPKLERCDFTPWKSAEPDGRLLQKKVKQFGLVKQQCKTVMELGEYTILSVEMPDVPSNELRSAVRWQIKDLIDYHVDDAVIDVFDMPASSATSQKRSMYVVVSPISMVRQHVDRLQLAKANLTTIDIPELVLRNLSSRLLENDTGVAMIYLARNQGLLVITRQSTLYFARPLNMGYEQLNQSVTDQGIDSNPQFDQLVLEVQRSLDYYDRYFQQPPVSGLVLTPTEITIPELDNYLKQALGLSVRTLDLGEIIDCDLSTQEQAHYLTAVGAAMRHEPAPGF